MTDFSIKKQLDEWCLESIFDILPYSTRFFKCAARLSMYS